MVAYKYFPYCGDYAISQGPAFATGSPNYLEMSHNQGTGTRFDGLTGGTLLSLRGQLCES